MTSPHKTEELKVRVDPLSKKALEQLARQEELTVSAVIRRALKDAIMRGQSRPTSQFNG